MENLLLQCSQDIAIGATSLQMLDRWKAMHSVRFIHRSHGKASSSRFEIMGSGVKLLLSKYGAAQGDAISVSVDSEGRLIFDADTTTNPSAAVAEAAGRSGVKSEEGVQADAGPAAAAPAAAAAPTAAENPSVPRLGVVLRGRNERSGSAQLGAGGGPAGGGEAGGVAVAGGSSKAVAGRPPAGSGARMKVEARPATTPAAPATPAVPAAPPVVSRRKSTHPKRVVRRAAPEGPGRPSAVVGAALAAAGVPVKAEPVALPAAAAAHAALPARAAPATAAAGRKGTGSVAADRAVTAMRAAAAATSNRKRSGTAAAGRTVTAARALPSATPVQKRSGIAAAAAGRTAPMTRAAPAATVSRPATSGRNALAATVVGRKRMGTAAVEQIAPVANAAQATAVAQMRSEKNAAPAGHLASTVVAAVGQRRSGTERAPPRGRAAAAGERPAAKKAVCGGPAGIEKVKRESGMAGAGRRVGGSPTAAGTPKSSRAQGSDSAATRPQSPARYGILNYSQPPIPRPLYRGVGGWGIYGREHGGEGRGGGGASRLFKVSNDRKMIVVLTITVCKSWGFRRNRVPKLGRSVDLYWTVQ